MLYEEYQSDANSVAIYNTAMFYFTPSNRAELVVAGETDGDHKRALSLVESRIDLKATWCAKLNLEGTLDRYPLLRVVRWTPQAAEVGPPYLLQIGFFYLIDEAGRKAQGVESSIEQSGSWALPVRVDQAFREYITEANSVRLHIDQTLYDINVFRRVSGLQRQSFHYGNRPWDDYDNHSLMFEQEPKRRSKPVLLNDKKPLEMVDFNPVGGRRSPKTPKGNGSSSKIKNDDRPAN